MVDFSEAIIVYDIFRKLDHSLMSITHDYV